MDFGGERVTQSIAMLQYQTRIVVVRIFMSLYRDGTNQPTPQFFLQNKSYQVKMFWQMGRVIATLVEYKLAPARSC
jgi:hypothetical protein